MMGSQRQRAHPAMSAVFGVCAAWLAGLSTATEEAVCAAGDATCLAATAGGRASDGAGAVTVTPSEEQTPLWWIVALGVVLLAVGVVVYRMVTLTTTVDAAVATPYWRFQGLRATLRVTGMRQKRIFMYTKFRAKAADIRRQPSRLQPAAAAAGAGVVQGEVPVAEEFDPPFQDSGGTGGGGGAGGGGKAATGGGAGVGRAAGPAAREVLVERLLEVHREPEDGATGAAGANHTPGATTEYDKTIEICVSERNMNACVADAPAQVEIAFVARDDDRLSTLDRDSLQLMPLAIHPEADAASPDVAAFQHSQLMQDLSAERTLCDRDVSPGMAQQYLTQLKAMQTLADEESIFLIRDATVGGTLAYDWGPTPTQQLAPDHSVFMVASNADVLAAITTTAIAGGANPTTAPAVILDRATLKKLHGIQNAVASRSLRSIAADGAGDVRPLEFVLDTSAFAHGAVQAMLHATAAGASADEAGEVATTTTTTTTAGNGDNENKFRLVFMLYQNLRVGNEDRREPAGAFVSRREARFYVPTPEIVPLPPAAARDGSEDDGGDGDRSRYYVGGAVEVVWLRSVFDAPHFAGLVGIALCRKPDAVRGDQPAGTQAQGGVAEPAEWERHGSPVPLTGGDTFGQGGLDGRRRWAFHGPSSPRQPGHYRVELFLKRGGDWDSVWQSAQPIAVKAVPRLRLVEGVAPAAETTAPAPAAACTQGQQGQQHVQQQQFQPVGEPAWHGVVGTPFVVEQPLPAGLGSDIRSSVALYRIVSCHEPQLRKSGDNAALQPTIDAFFDFREAHLPSVVSALEALGSGGSAAAHLREELCVPVDPATGRATLAAPLPGYYVAAYKQVSVTDGGGGGGGRKPPAAAAAIGTSAGELTQANGQHLLEVLKHWQVQTVFFPPPVIRGSSRGGGGEGRRASRRQRGGGGGDADAAVSGSGSRRRVAVEVPLAMGAPIVGQFMRLNKREQQGHVVLQRAIRIATDGTGASTSTVLDERYEALQRGQAGAGARAGVPPGGGAVLSPRTATTVDGLAAGCYSAVLCAADGRGKEGGGGGGDGGGAGEPKQQCCAILDFEVGMHHNPRSTIAEALQFRKQGSGAMDRATSSSRRGGAGGYGGSTGRETRCRSSSTVEPASARWVDLARQPVAQGQDTGIVTVVGGPAWVGAVRAMQQRLGDDEGKEGEGGEFDAEETAELMDDLRARIAALGMYAEKEFQDGTTEYVHESGGFVMRRVVDHRARTAHWQIFRERQRGSSSTSDSEPERLHSAIDSEDEADQGDEEIEVALRSEMFSVEEADQPSGSDDGHGAAALRGPAPFQLQWEMRELETREWAPCTQHDAGSGNAASFRVLADADDPNRQPSSCRITFDRNNTVVEGAGAGPGAGAAGQLPPGTYRLVYVERGLPLAVSTAVYVVRRPHLTAQSHVELPGAAAAVGPAAPRRMHEVGASVGFSVDGKRFDPSTENNLSVHVLPRTLDALNADQFRFVPRLDFVRGNASTHATTVSVRLPPHQPPESLGEDFVALFPFPLPTMEDGQPDTARFVPGTAKTVAAFVQAAGGAGAAGAGADEPVALQHGCLCLVPLWGGLSHLQLEPGLYAAGLVHKPAAPGMLHRVTSLFRAPSEAPTVVSTTGQCMRVYHVNADAGGAVAVAIEEDPRVYRPPLDPLAVFDPVARGGAPELEEDGVTPTRDALRTRNLVLYLDDPNIAQDFVHAAPAFLARHPNLCVALRARVATGIRALDLVQYEPPSGSGASARPARVRRVRSLLTLAKISQFQPVDDNDWGDWHTLRVPGGAAGDASSVVCKVGEVAFVGARSAVSGLHGRRVVVAEDTRLYPLGATAAGDEFLALAPRTMELLWVSSSERGLKRVPLD